MAGDGDIDWLCITDDSQLTSDDWEVVVIEPSFALDTARSARKVKMLPPTQVRDDGISLWIDNPVWDEHPRRFLEHAREIEAIHRRDFPPSVEEWTRKFRRFRPVASARRFAQRPLLVMHGEEDDSVPVSDARQLVNAHGSAELSLFEGAGHRLRHDHVRWRCCRVGSTACDRRACTRPRSGCEPNLVLGSGCATSESLGSPTLVELAAAQRKRPEVNRAGRSSDGSIGLLSDHELVRGRCEPDRDHVQQHGCRERHRIAHDQELSEASPVDAFAQPVMPRLNPEGRAQERGAVHDVESPGFEQFA